GRRPAMKQGTTPLELARVCKAWARVPAGRRAADMRACRKRQSAGTPPPPLGGRFLQFPIGDRRCKRTRASASKLSKGGGLLNHGSSRWALVPQPQTRRVVYASRAGLGDNGSSGVAPFNSRSPSRSRSASHHISKLWRVVAADLLASRKLIMGIS